MKQERAMNAAYKTRRANLKKLAEAHGTAAALSRKLGYSSRAFVSELLSGPRPFTETTARRIEEKLKLPAGWLDQKHTGGNGK